MRSPVTVRLTDDGRFYGSFTATDDGSMVAFLAESGPTPADVYVADVSGVSPRRLTSHNPQIDGFLLGEQRGVRGRSRADGEGIGGVVNLPAGPAEAVSGRSEPAPGGLTVPAGMRIRMDASAARHAGRGGCPYRTEGTKATCLTAQLPGISEGMRSAGVRKSAG